MRNLSTDLQDHLNSGATTTCTCWIVRCKDDTVLGFTNHDEPLEIEGITCEAVSGFSPTQAISDLGLGVDNQDIEGAISSEHITEESLKTGKFDGARVEVWIVNWASWEERHHLRTGILGEVTRDAHHFKAELRGLTSLLNNKNGRTFSRRCDAILGDDRCRVDLNTAELKVTGSVVEVLGRREMRCSGTSGQSKNWFASGNLTWTSGRNDGVSIEVTGNGGSDNDQITLWKAMSFIPEVGDTFELTAGCDKSFETCRSKFNNGVNFQGCPHMPGTDFAYGYAGSSEVHDGSPLAK